MRRLVCLFLLVMLPLHGFAMQFGGMGAHTTDVAHAMEHALEVNHHHHADGTVHYDDSEASAEHAQETPVFVSLTAIPSSTPDLPPSKQRLSQPPPLSCFVPDAIAAVPIRPPSILA